MSRLRSEAVIMGSAGLGVIGAIAVFGFLPNKLRYQLPDPVRENIDEKTLVGPAPEFRGNPNAALTLVEFGDYECPSCKANEPEVRRLLARQSPPLKFVFRHAPMNVHPLAKEAALLAERARSTGRFWLAHDLLFELDPPLRKERLRQLEAKLFPDSKTWLAEADSQALARVQRDNHVAENLNIHSTPTFFLYRGQGDVVRLFSLSQLEEAMKR